MHGWRIQGTIEGKLLGWEKQSDSTISLYDAKSPLGVVVQLEGRQAIIEGIDLKVWAPPVKGND